MKRSLIDARFKKNVLFSYGTQLAAIGAGFISLTLITRYAGIDTYGRVAILTALAGILINLMTFRTNEAVINFYKRGRVENDLGLCRLALIAGIALDLTIGLALFLIMKILAPAIADNLLKQVNMEPAVVIFSGVVLATFLRGTAFGLLVAEERFRVINVLNVAEQVLKVVLLSLAVYVGITLNLENIILMMLISSIVVTSTVYGLPLRRLFGDLRLAKISNHYVRNYARFSLSTFVSSSLKAGNQNMDTMMLGYLTNPAIVGIYNLFKQVLSPMNMLAAPYSAQAYPRFVQAATERDSDAIRDTIVHANNLLIKRSVLFLIFITIFLSIYGEWNSLDLKFKEYFVFAVMVISAVLSQQLWWGRPFSLAINPTLTLRANVLSMILTISFVYLLTKTMGLTGVALGMLINYLGVTIYYRFALRRVLNA